MDVYELRRANLARLLEESGLGAKSKLAMDLDISAPNISHWLHGRRKIHEDTARAIEHALGRNLRYLDKDPKAPADLEPAHDTLMNAGIEVHRAIERNGLSMSLEEVSDLQRKAFKHAMANGGKVDPTAINVLVLYYK